MKMQRLAKNFDRKVEFFDWSVSSYIRSLTASTILVDIFVFSRKIVANGSV